MSILTDEQCNEFRRMPGSFNDMVRAIWQAAIASQAEEIETLRMQLAACGVAAMANTDDTRAQRIGRDNPYWSASYGDVCAAVDREMALRGELDALRAQEPYAWTYQSEDPFDGRKWLLSFNKPERTNYRPLYDSPTPTSKEKEHKCCGGCEKPQFSIGVVDANGDIYPEPPEPGTVLYSSSGVTALRWQPIATAPKDGSLFIAYHPTFANSFWILGYAEQSLNGFTHWMPLPRAPGEKSSCAPISAPTGVTADAEDARRYRWLRSKDTGPSQVWELLSDDCQPPYQTLKCEADLDAAIDAAIAAKR